MITIWQYALFIDFYLTKKYALMNDLLTFLALTFSFRKTKLLPLMIAGVSFPNETLFYFSKELYEYSFSLSPVMCLEPLLSMYHSFSCPSAYKAMPHLSDWDSFLLHILGFNGVCSFWSVGRNLLLHLDSSWPMLLQIENSILF